MKRVKVLLVGLLREWDICSTGFSKWNQKHPNVEFDFYLATWKGNDIYSKDPRLNLKGLSIHTPEQMFELMSDSKKTYHKIVDRDTKKGDIPQIQHFYTYLIYKAKELGKSEKYDRIFLTRPDIVIDDDFLREIANDNDEDMRPNTIVASETTVYHKQLFIGTDIGFYGLPEDINTFCNMFEDIYIKDNLDPFIMHILQPEYMAYKGITPLRAQHQIGHIVRNYKAKHRHLFISRYKAKQLVGV